MTERETTKEESRLQVLLAIHQTDIQVYLSYVIADSAGLIGFTAIVWTLILSGVHSIIVLATIFMLFFFAVVVFYYELKNLKKLNKAREALNDLLLQYS
jgi:cbb3-type cytochrome oxidase subunit 3